jgi:8-oxo-dGTP diphosphatase
MFRACTAAALSCHRLQQVALRQQPTASAQSQQPVRSTYTIANGQRVPQVGIAVVVLRASPAGAKPDPTLVAHPSSDPSTQPTDVLLVQRANAPMRGWWGLPGGKLEAGETFEAAGAREVLEECNLVIETVEKPITTTQFIAPGPKALQPHEPFNGGHYVLIFLRALPLSLGADGQRQVARAGDDAARVCWFPVRQLPAHLRSQAKLVKQPASSEVLQDETLEEMRILPDVLKVLRRDGTIMIDNAR